MRSAMHEPIKAMSASQTPEELASIAWADILKRINAGPIGWPGDEAANPTDIIAAAISTAEAAAYERGKLAGQADEREACAAICDEALPSRGTCAQEVSWMRGARHCAQAILERGQKEKAR